MNARKLSLWYKAVADAEDALAACPKSVEDIPVEEKSDPATLYRDAVVSARNVVLANDPRTAKGELLGTISTAPTAAKGSLVADGLEDKAEAELLAVAADLRAQALALVIPEAKPAAVKV